jgi:hypothetical protein
VRGRYAPELSQPWTSCDLVAASPTARKETTMAMGTFVNLPVQDLAKAREFFTKIGFSFNEGFRQEHRMHDHQR